MRAVITARLVEQLRRAAPRAVEVWDTRQPGLVLRLRPSGHASYGVRYGRTRRLTLGPAGVLTPEQARALARAVLGDVARGTDPAAERRRRRAGTLRAFIEQHYRPWAVVHLVRGAELSRRVLRAFAEWADRPMADLTPFALERWKSARRAAGRRDTTIKRDLEALRAVLSKAVAWRVLAEHPMRGLRLPRVDPRARVRYLSDEEEARLRAALEARDAARRAARDRHNQWRRARGFAALPAYGAFTDHLTPLVLLALNTGLRRGELFRLRWCDVDLAAARLTVRAEASKTKYARHVPLNREARAVLAAWRRSAPPPAEDALVFPGDDGRPMTSLKTAWLRVARAAGLREFTFHDLRHHFASKLVMAGVDLYAVGELLGHRTPAMTVRYAHLSPDHLRAAVERLTGARGS